MSEQDTSKSFEISAPRPEPMYQPQFRENASPLENVKPETAQPVDAKPEQPWTVGKWHDLKRYQCNSCPFDTLELAVIQEHYQSQHAPIQPVPKVSQHLVDRFGNPIAVEAS